MTARRSARWSASSTTSSTTPPCGRGTCDPLGRLCRYSGRLFIQTPAGRREARGTVSLSLLVQGHKLWPHPKVVDALDDDVVIGSFFMRHWYIRLDPKRNRLVVNPRDLVLRA